MDRTRKAGPPRPGEEGFTLIEVVVASVVSLIVFAVIGSALISMSTTANRNQYMITDEQAASTVLAQMGNDIRSAHTLAFPTGGDPTEEMVLAENGQSNPIVWIYTPAARTLDRYQLVLSATCTTASFAPTCLSRSGPSVKNVANPAGDPMFAYYGLTSSAPLVTGTTADDSNVANCATRIEVDLYVSAPQGTTGVGTYNETTDVALTDQTELLSTPGNGQC